MARPSNAAISLVYASVALVLGAVMMLMLSPDFEGQSSVSRALRLSAQLAFVNYVIIFVARPSRQLLPNGFTGSLLRKRPYFGVSLAAIMSVHLALIAWLFIFVIHERPPLLTLIAGGVAYLFILLMLLTTYAAPARALGARNWRRLHKTGLYYIGAIYLNALVGDVIGKPSDPVYLAIGVLMVFAIAVRLAAFVKIRTQRTAAIESDR